ncbi:DUF4142 domain-containing protein [Nocardia sp. BMG51109]|uniref:DUF4142 domain-containing protein n=1 Tax=Nocardia sp. BMG51109 TaxID=1056816 RepID=UPI000A0202F4|nr:DUF4142 domain-containing protein [Nocardia sp. BMG51109]
MVTPRRMLIAGVSALVMGAGAAGVANADPAAAQSDQDYLAAAHQTNLTEMAAGGRAAAMASCPAVQRLGSTFVADHSRLDGMVTTVAARTGVMLPLLPNGEQQQTLAATSTKLGRDFDIAWLQSQEQGHLAALRDGRQALAASTTPDVRSVAEQATPIVEEHLAEIRTALGQC